MNISAARSGVDPARVAQLKRAEDARFAAAHPRSAELLARGRTVMPNGVPMAWHVGSEQLGRRFGLPKWQYTSSASQANTEAIRVARVATGRDRVLMFDGKYHG